MKLFLSAILILTITSCGEAPLEDTTGTGHININQLMEFDEEDYLLTSERTLLTNVCNAIDSKQELFERSVVNKGVNLQFRLKKTACGGALMSDSNFQSEVTATARGLELLNAGSGGFKDIITLESSLVKDFCSLNTSSANLQRGQQYRQSATWLKLVKGGTGDCNDRGDQACLVYYSGSKVDSGNKYTINVIEVLKVAMDERSRSHGVVVKRLFVSNQACQNEKEVSTTEQIFLSF